MPPKISFVRHGQGYHNLTRNYELRDPLLTPLGHDQCAALQASYPDHQTVDLIIASPLRRTIQTASYSFGPALARQEVPFLLEPKLQEIGSFQSDRGLDPEDLKKWLSDVKSTVEKEVGFDWEKIDASGVGEGYNSKTGYWAYTHAAISNRAADIRNDLFLRPENHIIVVSHGAIAHFFTEDWDVADPMLGTTWANCEVRDYVFSETSVAGDAHLVETPESVERRAALKGVRAREKSMHVVQELGLVQEDEVAAK